MQSPRVSVTTLEAFRKYQDGESTEKDFLKVLRGEFKPNDYTKVGSAFHHLLDRPGDARLVIHDRKRYKVIDQMLFPEEVAELASSFRREHPAAVSEVPVTKTYLLSSGPITVSGRLDVMEGVVAFDHKVCFQPTDPDAFMNSVQWKFYCDMVSGIREFRYPIYEVEGYTNLKTTCSYGVVLKGLKLHLAEPVVLYPYNSLRSELVTFLYRFMNYIEYRKYHSYLKSHTNERTKINPAAGLL